MGVNGIGGVRAILIDDHGCLTHTGSGLAHRVGAYLAGLGWSIEPDLLARLVSQACRRHVEFPLGRILTVDDESDAWTAVWTDVLAALHVPYNQNLILNMHTACHYLAAKRAYADSLMALDALGVHFRLCLATNALPMVQPALEALGLWRAFDLTFVSTLIGAEKPDHGFFRAAAAALDLPPSQALLVDDLPENVQGAREFGMHAVLIDRSGGAAPGSVRSLTDLVDLVRPA
jgi:HAD superfamily hydrolase (TIGR01509 family)